MVYLYYLQNNIGIIILLLFNKISAEQKTGCNLNHKVPLLWKPEGPWTLVSGSADTPDWLVIKWNPGPNQEEGPSDLFLKVTRFLKLNYSP